MSNIKSNRLIKTCLTVSLSSFLAIFSTLGQNKSGKIKDFVDSSILKIQDGHDVAIRGKVLIIRTTNSINGKYSEQFTKFDLHKIKEIGDVELEIGISFISEDSTSARFNVFINEQKQLLNYSSNSFLEIAFSGKKTFLLSNAKLEQPQVMNNSHSSHSSHLSSSPM